MLWMLAQRHSPFTEREKKVCTFSIIAAVAAAEFVFFVLFLFLFFNCGGMRVGGRGGLKKYI